MRISDWSSDVCSSDLIWGRLVAGQPDQVGHVIIDQKAIGLFMPPVFPAVKADSIAELAGKIGLDPQTLASTVESLHAAVRDGTFAHTELDDCRTEGLDPPQRSEEHTSEIQSLMR